MDIVSGIAVFIIIWWTVIFIVLPWGLKRDERGLPENTRLKQKLVITTAIAVVLWFGVYGMVRAGFVDFRGMANSMMEQDYGS